VYFLNKMSVYVSAVFQAMKWNCDCDEKSADRRLRKNHSAIGPDKDTDVVLERQLDQVDHI
jgi:hypothetical protein